MPAGAWSGGLWGSRLGWRWGWGGLGASRRLRSGEGLRRTPGRGRGRGRRAPAPPGLRPLPLAAVAAAGLGRRAARRAELGGGSGGRGGRREAAPRHRAPSPALPHHGAERGGGGGAGPGPPGLGERGPQRPGGGGRGAGVSAGVSVRACECVSAALRRARRALARPCVPGAGVCGALLVWPSGCVPAVEPRCCVRPRVCPRVAAPSAVCLGGCRAPIGLCAGVCVGCVPRCGFTPLPPSECVRAVSCVGCLCPDWMSIPGSVWRVCPLGCPFVCVCGLYVSKGVCLCVHVRFPGGGGAAGAQRLVGPLCGSGGGGSLPLPRSMSAVGGPRRSLGEAAMSSLPGGWVGGMGSR